MHIWRAESLLPQPPDEFHVGGFRFRSFDLGGPAYRTKRKDLWIEYAEKAAAMIFIVDSKDQERFAEAKALLAELISCKALQGKPVLLLGNKADLGSAVSEDELRTKLGLRDCATGKPAVATGGIRLKLFMCSAVRRVGFEDAFRWLDAQLGSALSGRSPSTTPSPPNLGHGSPSRSIPLGDDAMRGFVCFEMIRSIWLPTNATLRATTLCSIAATTCVVVALRGELAHWRGAETSLACLLSLTMQYGALAMLRAVEETLRDMSADVIADRAMSPLALLSLPAMGLGMAIGFCDEVLRCWVGLTLGEHDGEERMWNGK